jgi:DNA-binding NarL/FixJ family response regulator
MTDAGKIRILIADDFKLLRDVIRLHLERAEDMQVIGEAPNLNDALDLGGTLQPDVIIMNDYLPPIDSAHAAELFRKRGMMAGILVISMDGDQNLVARSFRHGVDGFMHKDELNELLADAVRSVHQGQRYVSPKAREAYGKIKE